MRKKRWLTLAVAATLVAAACGGDDSKSDGGTAQPGGGSAVNPYTDLRAVDPDVPAS